MPEEKKAPHDWRAVGLNVKPHYTLRPEDVSRVEKIVDVFFYDANEHTHLCELTPSYYLRHLYTTVICAEGVSDDARDELDQRYAYEPTEDTYMHVRDVQGLTEFTAKYGDTPADGEATEEEVWEHWQGNCPI